MAAPGSDISLENPIAEGRVALIYAQEDGRVLKLARDWVPDDWMAYEFKVAGIVHAAGLPVPRPYALVAAGGKAGIVYDRLDGPTMLDRIGSSPQKAIAYGRMLGGLHAGMHAHSGADDLPDQIDRLRRKIGAGEGAPEVYLQAALDLLEELPPGRALLHGDFHPGNVILTSSGPAIIDWPDAARGHPLSDVARTLILASLGGLPEQPVLRAAVRALRAAFKSAYLGAYFKASPERRVDLGIWLYPVLFARLSEGIEAEREQSIRWLKRLHADRDRSFRRLTKVNRSD